MNTSNRIGLLGSENSFCTRASSRLMSATRRSPVFASMLICGADGKPRPLTRTARE